jgi:hypothetical protein
MRVLVIENVHLAGTVRHFSGVNASLATVRIVLGTSPANAIAGGSVLVVGVVVQDQQKSSQSGHAECYACGY